MILQYVTKYNKKKCQKSDVFVTVQTMLLLQKGKHMQLLWQFFYVFTNVRIALFRNI